MKKITSLIALLICLCTSASAQTASLDKKAFHIGEPVTEIAADTWYIMGQRRGDMGYAHYEGDAAARKRAATNESFFPDPLTGDYAANALVRFVLVDGTEDQYYIMWGNGTYWTTNNSQSAAVNPTTNKYDATKWFIYPIGEDGSGITTFGLNFVTADNGYGYRLDNNGNGGTLAMWDSGKLETTGGNNDWAIFSVTVEEISDMEAAKNALQAVYAEYSENNFDAGTAPGQYDAEAVAAFEAALDAATIVDSPEGASLTAEQIEALAQAIKDTYEAVVKTRVPFAAEIAEGYYFITNALDFTETTTTEDQEDPDTGETIPGETITNHITKALYTDGTAAKWATINREDANYLWKVVAAGNKQYHLINCQTDAQFTKVATSANVTLSAESDSLVVFDVTDKVDGDEATHYNIRLAAQAERDYFYLHCGGHGGGSGKSGNIVGWATGGATDWNIEAVDEATALAIIEACSPAKALKEMKDSAAVIVAEAPAKITITKDQIAAIDNTKALITEATQLHSPMTTADTQCEDIEEVYTYLLDGNTSTYWHSAWEGGNRPDGADYIQISGIDATSVAYVMTRRAVVNDHITSVSVYGYDEENDELTKEQGELLASFDTPFTSNTEVITSPVIPTNGHNVLRVYEEGSTNSRGYWHMSEFQMYPATVSQPYATTQYEQHKAQVDALAAALDAWKAIDMTTVETVADIQTQFDALASAYAEFCKFYVDPSDLRAAVKNAPNTDCVKVGNNPGEWKAGAAGAVTDLVAKAQAYDESGKYTPAESAKFIADLESAEAALYDAANKIETGKWYNFRFATEEEYEANGWDKTGAKNRVSDATGVELSMALFGKIVTVATGVSTANKYTNTEGNEATETIFEVENIEDEDATMGHRIYYMPKEEISNPDMALWRFVAVGDSAYAIQNKATGLYIRTSGSTGATSLSVHPMLFNQKAVGFGKNLLAARSIVDGASSNYLHAQRDGNMLVTWNADGVESNSTLYIEEVEAVSEEPSCNFTWSLWPGQVQTVCYPSALEVVDGDVQFYTATYADSKVTLNPIEGNALNAGQPAVMIVGSVEDYEKIVTDEADENYNADAYVNVTMKHGESFTKIAGTSASLVGSFVQATIGSGCLWAEGNTFVMTKKSNNTLGANTAYIDAQIEDLESTVEFEISDEKVDGISNAIVAVSKIGGIYTLDGKFVGKGNLNSLKAMPNGIYVVNGVKVIKK